MNETLGKRLQSLRKKANLTQEEIATRLNITPQAVSKWENDISAPDISLIADIADMLGVSTDELLGKKPQTVLLSKEERKPIDSLILKIKVLSSEGDKVNVNLPLALVKIFIESGMAMPEINGTDVLKNIDFSQVLLLCEQGLLGKIIDVESADGDIVEIWVE